MQKNRIWAASMLAASLAVLAPAAAMADDVVNNGATRAFDRAAGTDASGAYPAQRDGTPGNPPGTMAGRAYDRAANTNTSGAYPANDLNGHTSAPAAVVGNTLNGNPLK